MVRICEIHRRLARSMRLGLRRGWQVLESNLLGREIGRVRLKGATVDGNACWRFPPLIAVVNLPLTTHDLLLYARGNPWTEWMWTR